MSIQAVVSKKQVLPLDLNFQGIPGTIAAYLIPHAEGAVLVESGPGSTVPGLVAGLQAHGYQPENVTDVLLTHIHLDHAGAAGWLARQGARIHVHPAGAPHLIQPEKLLNSAGRIYGDQMETLWGEFLPVPEDKLFVLKDGEPLEVGGLSFQAIDTPGHANHHLAYLFGRVLFSGDMAGVRLTPQPYLRLPTPPPEFDLAAWRRSLQRLQALEIDTLAPTHFGLHADPKLHLALLEQALIALENWMEEVLPSEPDQAKVTEQLIAWEERRSLAAGQDPSLLAPYELTIPSWMSAAGILRYWHKARKKG